MSDRKSRSTKHDVRLQKPTNWRQDHRWILGSRTKQEGKPVFKFCYHPPTGRLWLGYSLQNHKTIYNVRSGRTLDEIVRGIYFRERRLIYLRGHENEEWLQQTATMLRTNGLPKNHRVVWGPKAASQLRHLLEGL